ncbi:uncharacterized protein LOC6557256 isoform X2 [Drosophila grimshawi]|uniref:uncharacterized protein LOC6557256 isoform X2 n=1 Tax=Drosophila grimshawi TaxID=7222 RepID=UPI001C9328B7|nr:uncharacterized protein LOC6557256 isoform X2 [Drosophila grimshawi]
MRSTCHILWYFNELSFLRGHDARTPQLASLAETSDMFWNDDDHDENESKNELNDDKDNDSEKESKVLDYLDYTFAVRA